MSDECKHVTELVILDKQGEEKLIENGTGYAITGQVAFEGALGISVEMADDAIEVSVDPEAGVDDPFYKQRWNDIINGVPPYSGPPYYISNINNSLPLKDGTFFLLGGLCPQLGLFDHSGPGNALIPSNQPASLEFFDMCEACLDCGDYSKLFEYTDRIESWLSENKDANLTSGIKLFKQYQAVVHYWNYLVHTQSLILTLSAQGSTVIIKTGYRCLGCGPFRDVTIDITIEMIEGDTPILPGSSHWIYGRRMVDPQTIKVTVDAGIDAEVTIDSIDKNQYAIIDLYYDPQKDEEAGTSSEETEDMSDGDASGSSSSEEASLLTNTYKVTAVWEGTHLGASVTREKIIQASGLLY